MAKIVFIGDVFCEKQDSLTAWPSELHGDCCVMNFEYVYDNGKLNWEDAAEGKTNLKGTGNPFITGFKKYVATLSNNHVLDYSQRGCESTLEFLKSHSVEQTGLSGPDTHAKHINLIDGVTLSAYMFSKLKYTSLAGCKYTINELDVDKIIEDAKKAKEAGSKFHVVSLHWGTELLSKPWPNQVQQAHALIDSGVVDLVIGMHPHCLQPIERYNGKLIFYSIGNCVFPNFTQEGKFRNGRPCIVYACSWGEESKRAIVPVVDTNNFDVEWSMYRYSHSKLTRLSTSVCAEGFAPKISVSDTREAIWRRAATGLRLLARMEFGTSWFNLKSAIISRKSYGRTLDALKGV